MFFSAKDEQSLCVAELESILEFPMYSAAVQVLLETLMASTGDHDG
jgi:hypothetical protein